MEGGCKHVSKPAQIIAAKAKERIDDGIHAVDLRLLETAAERRTPNVCKERCPVHRFILILERDRPFRQLGETGEGREIDSLFSREHNENKQSKETAMPSEKYIVLPFKKNRGNLVPGEMRQASNEASAERIAGSMASRFVGVAAFAVLVDEESGDMSAPRLIAKHGEIADLTAA